MKETTKMSRTVGTLEKMYNAMNQDKFKGKLPTPIITVQSKPGTYGHCSVRRIWRRKDDYTYELNIAAEHLASPIEEIINTLLHEMVHIKCLTEGIKDVSRGGQYHNDRFREEAEKTGMKCEYTGKKCGWNTITSDMELEYAIKKGWSEFLIERANINKPTAGGGPASGPDGAPTASAAQPKSHIRKYQCPKCKNSVRASKIVNIICGDCLEKMEEQ